MKITVSNKLKLSDIPKKLCHAVCERLKIQNPKWIENNKMGRWNGNTPEHLRFYEKTDNGGLIAPRKERATIYDNVDSRITFLRVSAKAMQRVYKQSLVDLTEV